MINFIERGRTDSAGQPKPIEHSKGVKWALISTISVLAAAIFAVATLTQIVMAGLTFASGAGIPLGFAFLMGAAISIGVCVQFGLLSKEFILNAKYHLNPPHNLSEHKVTNL